MSVDFNDLVGVCGLGFATGVQTVARGSMSKGGFRLHVFIGCELQLLEDFTRTGL